ncbi:MAG: hypothetical protein ACXVEV_09020 [Nocardioidaceae bacterium]
MPTEEITAAAAGTGTLGDRTVNRMGFGSMRITADPDRALAVRVLRRAVDLKREDDELVRVCAERRRRSPPGRARAVLHARHRPARTWPRCRAG